MEILGERPVWSMSDSEQLSALDAAVAEHARMQTLIWQLTASLDASGYAKDLGAADTARLLSDRYRLDLKDARREVRLANRLTTYSVTGEALPDPAVPFQNPAHATADEPVADPPGETAADTDAAASAADDADDAGAAEAAGHGWRVNPAQAAAIVAALDQVPNTVPAADLAIAEQELIGLAVTHTPAQLRRAGRRIRDILDPTAPNPTRRPRTPANPSACRTPTAV